MSPFAAHELQHDHGYLDELGNSMRYLAVIIATGLLASCGLQSGETGSSKAQQALAKCKITARTSEGVEFRRNYFKGAVKGSELDEAMWRPAPYREYIALCMEAAGFAFADLKLKPPKEGDTCLGKIEGCSELEEGDACWRKIEEAPFPIMNVDEDRCYRGP